MLDRQQVDKLTSLQEILTFDLGRFTRVGHTGRHVTDCCCGRGAKTRLAEHHTWKISLYSPPPPPPPPLQDCDSPSNWD